MLNLLFHYECDRTPMPVLCHFALDDPGVIKYEVAENRQLTYYSCLSSRIS